MAHSTPRPVSNKPLRTRALGLALGAFVALTATACTRMPSMRLDHAEVNGVRFGLPPGVMVTVVMAVDNTNSYDVAVRAVRGQVVFAGRYPLPVDFRAAGQGVWLAAGRVTYVRIPIQVPAQLAIMLLQQAYGSPVIPYVFNGRADVTATSTFQIERDDYSVSAQGSISAWHIDAALRGAI